MGVRLAKLGMGLLTGVAVALSCSKGTSTIDKSRENSNYIAKPAKDYVNIPSRFKFSENIEFFVATNNGFPLPGIGSEFRAFDITALYEGGSTISPEKIPVMLKTFQENWNTNFFNLKSNGEISTVLTCEYATTRDACVGDLTGSSTKTDGEGKAFTGYKTPDGPGSTVAVVLKVPEGSSAGNLMQYSTIQIQSWRSWGKNGESPLEAALMLVPQLENDDGEPVVKAGVGFSVNLIVPGIPTTPKGGGYLFDLETTGVVGVDSDRVVVPNGKNVLCNFRGGLCSLPGGPFKVLSPTTMSITVKPSDPSFPVKTANVTIPVISGRARTIMLSTTYPATKVTNLCLSDRDFSKPCIELSADIDEMQIYPFLADEGGNFVGLVPTQWSATGPLATRLESDKVDLIQKIKPLATGSGIISVSTEKGISTQFTYTIRSGVPAKVEFKTEHSIGSNSTERVGVPFKVISTLYDKKDNLCVDYNTTFGVKLKLGPVYPATPPAGIVATATLADEIDQSTNKIIVTRGIGASTGSFTVVKVPDIAGGQNYPTISTLESTLNLSVINATPITILPGAVTQSQLRNLAGGLGTAWDMIVSGATGTSFNADRSVIVRSDQQYFFNNAGYDAGGNYVVDVPSKFWGVSYIYHPSTQAPFNDLVENLKDKDPSVYSEATACINPIPDALPSSSQVPSNQPEGNRVYCGVHRALNSKQGVSSPLASVGIPGAGRVLAIPLDTSIKSSISPILNITSGLASNIKIELVDTVSTAQPYVLASPIVAGKPFKIRLTATDNDGVVVTDYTGLKTFDFSSSSMPSWGGLAPVLPDGSKTCTFTAGVCELSETYSISRGSGTTGVSNSQTITSISLEQLVPNGEVGVTGIFSQFVRSIPGAEKYIYFTDKKGGTTTGSIALHPLSYPGGISIKTSEDFAFGVAIADVSGNYIRDMAASDGIFVKGFEGTYTDLTRAPDYFFNFTTGQASSVPWPADFTRNNVFTENLSPPAGIEPTPRKFYDPSISGDVAKISTPAFRNSNLYSLVLAPQNRLGNGFAVLYSSANLSLVGWPSPSIEIKPGAIDHAAASYFDPNDLTVNNTNAKAGECKNLTFKLADAKGNQLLDYTTIAPVRIKIFKVDSSHPNGIDDPKLNQTPSIQDYAVLNAPDIPGPIRSGFSALVGTGGVDASNEAKAKSSMGEVIDPISLLKTSAYYADWWEGTIPVNSGSITFPGTVCFQAGQTLQNGVPAPTSQFILQLEIEPTTYANISHAALVSRGAGRLFNSTYGSRALGSGHVDVITVSRGSENHLHGAFKDSFIDPQLAWLGPTNIGPPNGSGSSEASTDQLGIEAPCPYPLGSERGGCQGKTVYWHIHDKACNFLGPASSVAIDASATSSGVTSVQLTALAVPQGPLGSAGLAMKANEYFGGLIEDKDRFKASPAFVTSGALRGSWWAVVYPGQPKSMSARFDSLGGSLNVDESFSVSFGLKDQYGNPVAPALRSFHLPNPYAVSRTRKIWTNVIPSNAPTGGAPVYDADPSSFSNNQPWTFSSSANALVLPYGENAYPNINMAEISGFQFRRANEPITFSAEFKDQVASAWCAVAGRCASPGIQTYTTSITLNLQSGAAVDVEILSLPGQSGLPFKTSNFPSIFSSVEYPFTPHLSNWYGQSLPKEAYACLKDQYGNRTDCDVESSWSVVEKKDKNGTLTNEPVLSRADLIQSPTLTNKFLFSALREGTAKIQVEHSGFVATSDPLQVLAGPLFRLSLSTEGVADDKLTPVTISAGQQIPLKICLVDGADNIINTQVIHGSVVQTDPGIPYEVNFDSKVPVNAEGKGLVLSMGSGANFESQVFPEGAKSITFTDGCKTVYVKNYSAGNVAGKSLLAVSTKDPLRPSATLFATNGLFVSNTTPGDLDHFATAPQQTFSNPVKNTVPAWADVQTNGAYASAGGNRFDLEIYARDLYGNNVRVSAPVTLSRIKSDGVSVVTRPLICASQISTTDSTCLSANFSNNNQITISKLASDMAGSMYVVANFGTIGTKTSASQMINFQASIKTVKEYKFQNLASTIPAGQQLIVQVAAVDNSGAQVVGADDGLSSEVFSAVDQLGADLATHKSPNNVGPTIPSSYSFVSGLANVPVTFTKKEALQFRVRGTSGLESALGSINVLSATGLSYQITCRLVSNNDDCSGTQAAPYSMTASRANLFNLLIENVDMYGNKKAGPSYLYIAPVRQTGSPKLAGLLSSTLKTYQTISGIPSITFSGAAENGITLDNLYYGATNQTISFDLPNKDLGTFISKNSYINFLPHIDAVNGYQLTNFESIQFPAGTTKSFQVSALDYGGNVITGIDVNNALNAQSYVWSGSGVSLGGFNNVLPNAPIFTNGVSQNLSATFYGAESLAFGVRDNFTSSVSLFGENEVKFRNVVQYSSAEGASHRYEGTVLIDPKPPQAYVLSGISSLAEAGTPFSLSLSVKDMYGNPNKNWTDDLTFTYETGASPSIATFFEPVHQYGIAPNVTNQSFPNGTYTVPGAPFVLYRSNFNTAGAEEMTLLKIQGTKTVTASGLALSTSINIKTTPKAQIAYAKITNSPVYDGNNLTGVNLNYNADATYNYFAALFDRYGNFQTVSSADANKVKWKGTGVLAGTGKLTPTAGLSTVLAPKDKGVGAIEADCTLISGCRSDSTGTITVSTGPLSEFSMVDTITSGSVALGQEIPFSLCMEDAVGNTIDTPVVIGGVTITDPNATLNVELKSKSILDTPERKAIEVSTRSGVLFDANRLDLAAASNSITFVSGCAQLYAKIFSTASVFGATDLLQVRYHDFEKQPEKAMISSTGFDVPGVDAKPLDHYVTTALNLNGGKVEALSDLGSNIQGNAGGNRFSIIVQARDVYGNAVIIPNSPSKSVNLSVIKSDGVTPVARSLVCAAPYNDTSCLNPTISGVTMVRVDDLALDVAGNFYINAWDGSKGIKAAYSDIIVFNASPKTIKQYKIISTSVTNAGLETPIQVRAEDNSGNPVSGADSALNDLRFTWFNASDSSNMTDAMHKAPDGRDPILLTTLTFNGGVATPFTTFTKAEAGLKLNIRDNASPQNSSNNNNLLEVQPGLSLYYDIICKKAGGSSDCTGSSTVATPMLASAADKFNLEFRSLDQYKNPKLGNGSAEIMVQRLDGTATQTGPLESPSVENFQTKGINMASTAMVPKSNLFYRVGNQKVRLMIKDHDVSRFYNTPYLDFSPTIDTVTNFLVGTALSGTAGVQQSIEVRARDSGWNTITGIDGLLNSQTYAWSGLLQSPNGTNPVYPSSSLRFSGGVASTDNTPTGLTATIVKAGTAALTLLDNYVPCTYCSGVGGTGPSMVRAGSVSPVISHAPAASYGITGGGSSIKAGVPFGLTITALDEFANPATSWNADTLSFAWTGANPSVVNPSNLATVYNPSAAQNGRQLFAAGAFSSLATDFKLYKAESPSLTVTGTETAGTKNGTVLSGTRVFTVLPNDTAGYVRISANPVPTPPYLSGAVLDPGLQTDQYISLFAYLFDSYGNLKSDAGAVTWTGSGVLVDKLSPTTAATTTFRPITAGTGVVTASCTGVNAGCLPDSTATLDIQPSNVAKIVFVSPTPANNSSWLTTECKQLTVQTWDLVNNRANVNSNTTFTFTSTGTTTGTTGGNGDFYASETECMAAQGEQLTKNTGNFHNMSTLGGNAGTRTLIMTSGTAELSVWYANRTAVSSNGAKIVVSALSRTATLNATISADAAKRVSLVTSDSNLNAAESTGTTCLAIKYRFEDIWGNPQSLTAQSTINLQVPSNANNGGTIYSDSGCTAVSAAPRTLVAGLYDDTVYYQDTKANKTTFNILSTSKLNGSAVGNEIVTAGSRLLLNIDVLPGPFSITGLPSAGSFVKTPFTLNWEASKGVKDYSVTYGTNSICSLPSPAITVAASATPTTTINSILTYGAYKICVQANSYTTLGVPTIANYSFTIDSSIPTGGIQKPSLTEIGPATSEMGGTEPNTTFSGTATDAGSGLLKVELAIAGPNGQYWNGTSWQASQTWNQIWTATAAGTTSYNWSYAVSKSVNSVPTFTDGSNYTLTVQVTDYALNVNSATKSFKWDSTPPEVAGFSFGNLYNGFNYAKTANATINSTTGSGAVTYKYGYVDGASVSNCSTVNYEYSGTISSSPPSTITGGPSTDGKWILCVVGMDLAENVQSSPTSFTWFRDNVAPTISGSATIGPVNSAQTTALTATDSGAVQSQLTYSWTVDQASTCTNISVVPTNTLHTTISCGSIFANPVVKLTATDTAGNSSDAFPVTLKWDKQPRTISDISSSSFNNQSANADKTIDINVTFAGTTNSNKVLVSGTPKLKLNTGAAATYYSGSNTNVLTFRYTVGANDTNVARLDVNNGGTTTAIDLNGGSITDDVGTSGNVVDPTTSTGQLSQKAIKIDTTPPTLDWAAALPPDQDVRSKQLTGSIGVSTNDTVSYKYALFTGNGACSTASYTTVSSSSTVIPFDFSNSVNWPDGTITLCAQATDAAGNVQTSGGGYTTRTWTKDTNPPELPSNVRIDASVNTWTPTINWDTPAIEVAYLKVTLYSDSQMTNTYYQGSEFTTPSTSLTLPVNAIRKDGTYYLCVSSRDSAGNWKPCSETQATFSVETDTIHMSWFESGTIKYAKKDKTLNWVVTEVPNNTGVTYHGRTAIAVDSSGKPAIAFGTQSGPDSYFGYSRFDGTNWTEALLQRSTGTNSGGTLGDLVTASGTPTYYLAGFLAKDGNSNNFGVQTGITNSTNGANFGKTFSSQTQVFDEPTWGGAKDLGVFIDIANNAYTIATLNDRPVIKAGSFDFTPTLPTSTLNASGQTAASTACQSMPYVSGVSASSGAIFGIAGICLMGDGSCRVWYGTSTYTSSSPSAPFSAMNWTQIGIAKPSSCNLLELTLAHRPNIMQDKSTVNKPIVVWTDIANARIVHSSYNGTSWSNVVVKAGLTGQFGWPYVAIDPSSRSYVGFVNNGDLYVADNNSGAWTTPERLSTAAVSGFGGVAITGMKGRGNYSGGK